MILTEDIFASGKKKEFVSKAEQLEKGLILSHASIIVVTTGSL
jgi:hypothetical protein